MGNDIRVDSMNIAPKCELAQKSYDLVRNKEEEPSIWSHFDPMSLALNFGMTYLFQRKEFKSVKMDAALTGKDLRANKSRMVNVNQLGHLTKNLSLVGGKNASAFAKVDLEALQKNIEAVQNAGKVSSAELASLNKQYATLLNSNLKSYNVVQKGLTSLTQKCPGVGGELLRTYKSFKGPMILNEIFQELGPLYSAFTLKDPEKPNQTLNIEAGLKQIPKSAGRMLAGGTGYMAGAIAGAKIFGALGSVIPGAGTFIGGVIGSVFGFTCAYVGSQLARNAYNSVIPSEIDIAKIEQIDKFLDKDEKSESTKYAMKQEISDHIKYLNSALEIQKNATAEQDNETLEKITENINSVKANYQSLVELYKEKFGEDVLQELNSEATQTGAPNGTTGTMSTSQQTPSSSPNLTMTQNPYANNYMANMAMMNNGTTDWSSMLPLQLQNQYFGVIA